MNRALHRHVADRLALVSDFESVNEATYRRADVVSAYADQATLQEGEARVVARLGDLQRVRMLDIGVGGGRTTAYFADRVQTYAGIDYSAELVAATRTNFPDVDISHGDARDLSNFPDASFDLVLFSFNGIDYVSDLGRRQALGEVKRVLAPGGAFVFSSHNRDYGRLGLTPWRQRRLGRTMAKQSLSALVHTRRRMQMRRRELVGPDFAIVNDDAHRWSLLTYYISSGDQVAQLQAAGFEEVETFDQWGHAAEGERRSVWRHYVAR